MGETVSEPMNISLGVPQGSAVRPILFIMYIDNMEKLLKKIWFLGDDHELKLTETIIWEPR